jgi:hypothetical protein
MYGVAVEVLLAEWYPAPGHVTYLALPGGPSRSATADLLTILPIAGISREEFQQLPRMQRAGRQRIPPLPGAACRESQISEQST